MEALVWIGAGITVLGLAGLLGCAAAAMRARGAGLDEAALRARLGRLVAWNLAALGVSAIGLMCVIVGLALA